MTANELQIGDWVKVVPFHNENNSYNKRVENGHDIDLLFDFQGHVEPIPITSEILEKNEFKIGINSIFELSNGKWLDYYHHEHRLRVWWKGIDEWENHSRVKDIIFQCHAVYVHELQHALRLCKIDKKITL